MPSTMKGPAIFLAQFAGDAAPFNFAEVDRRMGGRARLQGRADPDLGRAACSTSKKAAESKAYCDEVKGICADAGVEITELSTHLQGQLVAVHPAYDSQFDGFAPAKVHNNPKARQKWAVEQMKYARQGLAASRPERVGLLLRRARLPLSLSVAAAPGRPDRGGVRRTRQALEADPRRL